MPRTALLLLVALGCSRTPAGASTSASEPATAATPPPASGPPTTWSFDGDAVDEPPGGFVFGQTGDGPPGVWQVRAEKDAPSGGKVLAQLDTDRTDGRFALAVASAPELVDVSVTVRCMPVSGAVDQACGLVARYRDADNYLLTRANALESNIRLYFVKDGERQQIASWNGQVTNAWHDYRFDVRGDHLEVYWDGARVLDHHDDTFRDAGKVGLWTKADSVTYFDDLAAQPLQPP